MLNSAFWDTARWVREDMRYGRDLDAGLSRKRLDWYRARIRQAVGAVAEVFPDAAISWVTHHYRESPPLLHTRFQRTDSVVFVVQRRRTVPPTGSHPASKHKVPRKRPQSRGTPYSASPSSIQPSDPPLPSQPAPDARRSRSSKMTFSVG